MARNPAALSKLMLARAPWDATDDAYAARIPFDCPHESRDLLRRMVAAGASTAHRISQDGRRIGLLVTQCEEGNAGRELVIQSVFLDTPNPAQPLTRELADLCEALARAEQCNCIRFHTCRPALARFTADSYGYRLSEIVMRKTLPSS